MQTPRIASVGWMKERADHATAVYNANYDIDGKRGEATFIAPWTVLGPDGQDGAFHTHAEALAWAVEISKPSVTQQRLDAAQKKWRAAS